MIMLDNIIIIIVEKSHPWVKAGMTPLHEAARSGSEGIIELLISFGADVNVRNIVSIVLTILSTMCSLNGSVCDAMAGHI